MSSIIGHIAAGSAVFMAYNRFKDRKAFIALPIFVFLAICPDFDYLAIWLSHANPSPRITHSILFGLATSLLAWLCTGYLRQRNLAKAPFIGLLIASLSHPFLDLLVGAHPVPLLWPLTNPDVSLPFGILPSAGRLALGNYYLWRNLLIELAILLPVFVVLVVITRRIPFHTIALKLSVIAPIWLAFLLWSIMLQR